MTAWIVNQRTGARTGPFINYVAAAEFRQKVLRPRLTPDAPCPYAIRDETAEQLGLPVCVLPGCAVLVGEWGDACETCLVEFGSMLRPGRRLGADEISDRDREVQAAYVSRGR